MIVSMTGFGKASANLKNFKVNIELKSVNSKQLDLTFRINPLFRDIENEFRTLLNEKAERGKIDVAVFVEWFTKADVAPKTLNKNLLKHYYQQLKQIDKELKAQTPNLLELALKCPDIFIQEIESLTKKESELASKTFKQALDAFLKHRKEEGKAIERDLILHLKRIEDLLVTIETEDKNRLPEIKNRIQKKLEENVEKNKIDLNRFEQELIYYLERNDITEEKVRLKTHCDYFRKTMKESAPGRKLAFICQEIGREINTIGSKANHAPIQRLVVEMKDELEKIKEQLNNVL